MMFVVVCVRESDHSKHLVQKKWTGDAVQEPEDNTITQDIRNT